MKKFRRRSAKRGEIIAMAITSVMVLGVLTVTGLYIKNRNQAEEQDGYYIDFDALEAEVNNKLNQTENENDLDFTGEQEEIDYSAQNAEAVQSGAIEKENNDKEAEKENTDSNQVAEVPLVEEIVVPQETAPTTIDDVVQDNVVTNIPILNFSEEETLVWPIVGSVIINYSMDKSVYYATLDQFKYSPAMIISAKEGEQVTAAAEAVVTRIYQDNELGNVVEMDLGDGYTLSYGQLHNVEVTTGQYVTTGQLIAQAGEPTKYYSVEGCNVYFKLTKDGEPVNPMKYLE